MITPIKRDPDNRFTQAALAHLIAAQDARNRYASTIQAAILTHGDLPLGMTHTSGVYNTAWPDEVKDRARFYARLIGEHMDLSLQCWLRAGRRIATWRDVKEPFQTLADGRISYY